MEYLARLKESFKEGSEGWYWADYAQKLMEQRKDGPFFSNLSEVHGFLQAVTSQDPKTEETANDYRSVISGDERRSKRARFEQSSKYTDVESLYTHPSMAKGLKEIEAVLTEHGISLELPLTTYYPGHLSERYWVNGNGDLCTLRLKDALALHVLYENHALAHEVLKSIKAVLAAKTDEKQANHVMEEQVIRAVAGLFANLSTDLNNYTV